MKKNYKDVFNFQNWQYISVFPFILSANLISFLKYNEITIFSAVALLSIAITLSMALIFSFILVSRGIYTKIILSASLFTFLGLISLFEPANHAQGKYFLTMHGLKNIFTVFSCIILFFYVIREKLSSFLSVFSVTLFLAVLFTPVGNLIVHEVKTTPSDINSNVPPYVHIIFDEHPSFDWLLNKNQGYFGQLTSDYLNNDFRIYGSVYARYIWSRLSLSSLVGLEQRVNNPGEIRNNADLSSLINNKLFADLRDKGYKINVLQSAYLKFCNADSVDINSCDTYKYADSERSPNATKNIFNQALYYTFLPLARVSILDFGNKDVAPNKEGIAGNKLSKKYRGYVDVNIINSASASLRVTQKVISTLENIKPGNAYFIHLLFPHHPYIYNESCQYLGFQDDTVEQGIEQVKCAHKVINTIIAAINSSKAGKESTVVMHGDHGFRTNFAESTTLKDMSEQELIQYYNTFYLVRQKGISPTYNTSHVALDELVKATLANNLEKLTESKDKTIYYYDKLSQQDIALQLPGKV